MKRSACFLLLAFLLLGGEVFSQNISDALRYSTLQYGGTARSLGAGNSLGALGADYSTLSTNPAGLANYRTSEFVFTPALRFTNSESTLRGGNNLPLEEQKVKFNIANLGMVFAHEPRGGGKWKSSNFAIGYNQLANFSQRTYWEGRSKGSLVDGWLAEAQSVGYDTTQLYGLGAGLGVQAGALYFDSTGTKLITDFKDYPDASIARSQYVRESGSINEMVLSYAGNYDDKLSLGMTIGVPFYNFKQSKTYTESDPDEEVLYFDDLRFDESLHTSGIGINLKLGAIWRVNQSLRLGAALHTPTLAGLTDEFDATLQYKYTDLSGTNSLSANGLASPFDYNLRTPWRAITSAAYLVPRIGFLSADVEYLDYSNAKFDLTKSNSDPGTRQYEAELNRDISNKLTSAVNIRVGGEAVVGRLRLRAGYNLLGTPFDAPSTKNFPNSSASLGIGIRQDWFYLDLGYRFSKATEQFSAYSGGAQLVDSETRRHDWLLTLGFKF